MYKLLYSSNKTALEHITNRYGTNYRVHTALSNNEALSEYFEKLDDAIKYFTKITGEEIRWCDEHECIEVK